MMIAVIKFLIFDVIDSDFRSRNTKVELCRTPSDTEIDTCILRSFDFVNSFLEGYIFIDSKIIDLNNHISTLETSLFRWSSRDGSDNMEFARFWHIDIGTDSFEFSIEFILEIFGFCRWKIGRMFILARICHALCSTLYEFFICELSTIIVCIFQLKIDIIEDREV